MLATAVLLTSLLQTPAATENYTIIVAIPKRAEFEQLQNEDFYGNDVFLLYDTILKKYGLIGSKRNAILRLDHKKIQPLTKSLFLARGNAEQDDTWALYNLEGEVVASSLAAGIDDPSKMFYKVNDDAFIFRTQDKMYSVVNRQGETLTKDYQSLRPFGQNAVSVLQDNKVGVIDLDDNIIFPFTYSSAAPRNDGFAVMADADKMYGLFKLDGTQVIKCQYDQLVSVNNGHMLAVNESAEAAIIDTAGKTLVAFAMRDYTQTDGRYIGWTSPDGTDSGIVDLETGKDVFKGGSKYAGIYQVYDRFFQGIDTETTTVSYNASLQYNKRALIDATKGEIAPMKYYDFKAVKTDEGPVFKLYDIEKKLQYYWLMNGDGKMIAEQVDADVQTVNGQTMIECKTSVYSEALNSFTNKSTFIGYDGETIFDLKFVSTPDFSEGLGYAWLAYPDSRQGYMNPNGKFVILKDNFRTGDRFSGGLAIVTVKNDTEKGYAYGVINKTGKFLLEPVFDYVSRHPQRDDLFSASTTDGFRLIIDKNGKQLFKGKASRLNFCGKDMFVIREPDGEERRVLYRLK